MTDFDVDRLLNLERRTGVKESEIDDFIRKASDVEAAIKGLRDGTVNPDTIKIEGIETEEDKKAKEVELEEKRRLYREKEEKLRLQRKKEEKERWWNGAEIFRPSPSSANQTNSENKKPLDGNSKDLLINRYTADYSKWETWTPDDAVSIQEQKEREAEEERKKNEEFEKNNPEFCQTYANDMKERKKSSEKKQETAEVLRLKGNKFFKNKDYDQALANYMEALKNSPFDAKLLLNIAQSYLKLKNYDDADEFLNRTLYLEGNNVKALSRKAFVLSELRNYSEALAVINKAIALDGNNAELLIQLKEISIMEKEEQSQKKLQQLLVQEETDGKEAPSLTGKNEITQLIELLLQFVSSNADEPLLSVESLQKDGSKLNQLQSALLRVRSLTVSIRQSFQREPLLSIYFCQEKGLSLLFRWTKWLHSLSSLWAAGSLSSVSYEQSVASSLAIANDLLDEKRASKQLFVDSKMYTFYKDCLLLAMTEEALPVQEEIVRGFFLLVKDEIYVKSKLLVFLDPKIWYLLAQLVGNVTNNAITEVYPSLQRSSPSNTVSSSSIPFNAEHHVHQILQTVANIFKEFFFSPNEAEKAAVKALDAVTSMNIVFSFGVALLYLSTDQSQEKESISTVRVNLIELLIDCFVGFSQHDHLKKFFVFSLPIPAKEAKPKQEEAKKNARDSTIISILIDVINKYSQLSANGIAILMNASIEITSSSSNAKDLTAEQIKENNEISIKVKQIIAAKHEGVELALSVLSMSSPDVNVLLKIPSKQTIYDNNNDSLIQEIDGIYYTRKVGLLSRLITVPAIMEAIISTKRAAPSATLPQPSASYHYDNLYQLCVNLSRLVRPNHQDNNILSKEKEQQLSATPKWVSDLLLHYIRIIAHLFSNQSKTIFASENMKKILFDTQLLATLLNVLPMPRMDCGEITETSVTQVPKFPISSVLAGNVVHILLQFVNNQTNTAQFSRLLFETPSYHTIEKCICAMATCQDIRVRKNISILLAKGCQLDTKIREKITHYRGLQMMMELQKEL